MWLQQGMWKSCCSTRHSSATTVSFGFGHMSYKKQQTSSKFWEPDTTSKVYHVPIVCYTLWVFIWFVCTEWRFRVSQSTGSTIYELQVKCSVRGDVGPACSSAGMIDRYILGIDHLYAKPVYRNIKECNGSNSDTVSKSVPSWCHATFDPEGIVTLLTAAATSIIGLRYGHILVQFQEDLQDLWNAAYPNVKLQSLISDQWKDMGWQGANPSTDFRGCGFISLENLLYFATRYQACFYRLLLKQSGPRATWEYPFAVAGINVTFMLICWTYSQVLKMKKGKTKSVKILVEDI